MSNSGFEHFIHFCVRQSFYCSLQRDFFIKKIGRTVCRFNQFVLYYWYIPFALRFWYWSSDYNDALVRLILVPWLFCWKMSAGNPKFSSILLKWNPWFNQPMVDNSRMINRLGYNNADTLIIARFASLTILGILCCFPAHSTCWPVNIISPLMPNNVPCFLVPRLARLNTLLN